MPIHESFVEESSSKGLYPTLKSFANGIGYTVDDKTNTFLPYYSDARINYQLGLIVIKSWIPEKAKAYLLAHELSHEYTRDVFGDNNLTSHKDIQCEQVTEAVAVLFLHEYGFDLLAQGKAYISMMTQMPHMMKPRKNGNYFDSGKLDGVIKRCYRQMSRDFWTFLNDGRENGFSGHSPQGSQLSR
jgi:hypothetical protein